MHEILFRGKRTDNGQWTYGFYRYKEELKKSFITIEIINENSASYFFDYEVIPETVGQFTGLLDKNGKKIFEGDIAKTEDGIIDYVVYADGCFCWARAMMCGEFTYGVSGYEVIGNIHDNPELLEDKA